ncbi:hypothetical protein [Pseudoalteromonas sp. GB56]
MNYKKGLVALAITGALATPLAANAAQLVTFGGQTDTANTTAAQVGPQTGPTNDGTNNAVFCGLENSAVITCSPVVNDDLTVDQILAGQDIDFDADTLPLVNGSFAGSARTDVSVGYAADRTIPNEATFTYTFTGAGGLAASDVQNVVLVAQAYTASGLASQGQYVEVGSVITSTTTDGVISEVLIQIDTAPSFLSGLDFLHADGAGTAAGWTDRAGVGSFVTGDALPAGTQLFLASAAADGSYNPLTMALKSTAVKGDVVEAQVSAVRNTANLPLDSLTTGVSTVITVTDGFEIQVVDQATNTIQVETERTTFEDCVANDETVDLADNTNYTCGTDGNDQGLTSRAFVQFASSADVGLQITDSNAFSFALSRKDGEPLDGVDTVTFGGISATKPATGTVYTGTGTLGTANLLDTMGTRLEAPIDITVNGVDALFPNAQDAADWVLSNVQVSGGALTSPVMVPVVYGETATTGSGTNPLITTDRSDADSVAVNGVTHVWNIDGAQFKVPYVYHIGSTTGYSSTIKVTNEFNTPAGIEADIIVAPAGLGTGTTAGNTAPMGNNTFIGIKLPMTIPAMGQYTFTGTDLIAAINAEYPGTFDTSMNWHIEATFLVNAPQNYVHAAAQNSDPRGRADSPVLYKTNNINDGRQWQ